MNLSTKNIIYIAMFIALIYISSLIRISVTAVPFTLQTMAVMLAACFLGVKKGLIAVGVYIIGGLIGLPLFTEGGGIVYITKHTFGYILAFIPAVIYIGSLKNKCKNFLWLFLLLFTGGIIMLFIGALYAYILLGITTAVDVSAIFYGYFFLFIPSELIKSTAVTLIYLRLKNYLSA